MLKPCLTCGRLTSGSYCGRHRPQTGRGSTRAWRKLRIRILERDNWTCQLCGNPATDVDHVHPVALGGNDDPGNLRAACAHCNRSRPI